MFWIFIHVNRLFSNLCSLTFYCYIAFLRDGLLVFFRNIQCQNTVFVFRMDILLGKAFAYIKAAAHAARVTFTSDVSVFFIFLILVESLLGTDGQISVIQFQLDLVFLKAREINGYFVTLIRFLHISLHHIFRMFPVQCLINIRERKIHPVIK